MQRYKSSRHKVSDIINGQWEEIVSCGGYNSYQIRILDGIRKCRTAALGGHLYRCGECGYSHKRYNSCRNRHCPSCQNTQKEKWIQSRQSEIIDTFYYHVVFTLPSALHEICLVYPRQLYGMLFRSAWQTLSGFGRNPKYLGAQLGATMILHTWGQNLSYHPHVHCIVPGGGLSVRNKWKEGRGRGKYLFPVKAMSLHYRGLFMRKLKAFIDLEGMELPDSLTKEIYRKRWVVYAKRPFRGPRSVIEYLGRYTHKTAISNHRLVSVGPEGIKFRYKDYKAGGVSKVMSLSPREFVRRFSLHFLPRGFTRIRHYGILAGRNKALLFPDSAPEHIRSLDWKELWKQKGLDVDVCPGCGKPGMQLIGEIRKRGPPGYRCTGKKLEHTIKTSDHG